MPFWRKKPFDRIETLAAADRARASGKLKKAVQLYRKVLAVDPGDVVVHGRLAPLLARTGERGAALASFEMAAKGHVKSGFLDRAAAVYVQAAECFPRQASVWEELARLHQLRGRRADAVRALLDGGQSLGESPRTRADGVRLLRSALELEPWHLDSCLALAGLLARTGERIEALALVEGVASRVRGRGLRRARAALFRLSPTPGNGWRWLRSALGGR